MTRPIAVAVTLALALTAVTVRADEALEQAADLARGMNIVDGHIDVPYRLEEKWEDVSQPTETGDFDYPRAVAGGLNTPFMSIYTPASSEIAGGSFDLANKLIDSVEAIVGRAPDKFALVTSVGEAESARRERKIGLAMGMENGAPIEGDLANLRHFHERGIRYITLAHSQSNHISDSSYDEVRIWEGLSPFGRELVSEMNRLGIMVDISHVSDAAFFEVLELSTAPVIASHSSARHFTPGFERNMSDEMIAALGERGGVIMINFGSAFLTEEANAYSMRWWYEVQEPWLEHTGLGGSDPQVEALEAAYREAHPYPYATVEDVADHIDHVVRIAGIDHVGIGSDYDGVGDSLPEGLKSVADYPNLIAELIRRDYTEEDIRKIMGENALRVWLAVEAAAESS